MGIEGMDVGRWAKMEATRTMIITSGWGMNKIYSDGLYGHWEREKIGALNFVKTVYISPI